MDRRLLPFFLPFRGRKQRTWAALCGERERSAFQPALSRPVTEALFEWGRALFNAGRHFEAHEVWEEAWRGESGATRLLLQGLIQIAAGYHKASAQGQPGGCVRLLRSGLEKLRAASASPAEGSLAAFLRAVEESLGEAERWERGEAAGLASAPRLEPLAPLDS